MGERFVPFGIQYRCSKGGGFERADLLRNDLSDCDLRCPSFEAPHLDLSCILNSIFYPRSCILTSQSFSTSQRATALFVLWPLLMAGTVAVVVELVTKAERVNAAFGKIFLSFYGQWPQNRKPKG